MLSHHQYLSPNRPYGFACMNGGAYGRLPFQQTPNVVHNHTHVTYNINAPSTINESRTTSSANHAQQTNPFALNMPFPPAHVATGDASLFRPVPNLNGPVSNSPEVVYLMNGADSNEGKEEEGKEEEEKEEENETITEDIKDEDDVSNRPANGNSEPGGETEVQQGQDEWACSHCTLLNNAVAPVCAVCRHKRAEQQDDVVEEEVQVVYVKTENGVSQPDSSVAEPPSQASEDGNSNPLVGSIRETLGAIRSIRARLEATSNEPVVNSNRQAMNPGQLTADHVLNPRYPCYPEEESPTFPTRCRPVVTVHIGGKNQCV
jgi:hypothetical protein